MRPGGTNPRNSRGLRRGSQTIAVGTALAGRPPLRSQRALLTHWAPASGSDVKALVRPGMADTYRRDPAVDQSPHALPIGPIALAPASQGSVPLSCHLIAKPLQRLTVRRHCVVRKVSADHAAQPLALLGDGPMPTSLELGFHLAQLPLHPLRLGPPHDQKLSRLGLPTEMQEAQEVEVLRLSLASGTSAGSCKASKLNDPSLVGMKLQRELLQPFAKLSQEPLGVPTMLEANHKVISKARDDDITPCVPSPPLLNPEIEGVVQVEVGQ